MDATTPETAAPACPDQGGWATVNEAAVLLNCTIDAVYKRIKSGALAYRKDGRLLVSRASIADFEARLDARQDHLSIAAACHVLRMREETLGRLLKDGTLPHTRDARRVYIPRAAVEAYAKRRSGEGLAGSAEAAAFLGMPLGTFHKRVQKGALPSVRIGWKRWFTLDDLHQYKQTAATRRAQAVGERKRKAAVAGTASVNDAARLLKCGDPLVNDLLRDGNPPLVMVEGCRRSPPDALRADAASQGPRVRKQYQSGDESSGKQIRLGELEERLEAAGLVLDLDAAVWAELVYKVLPERYARPAAPEDATDALPGSERKIQTMEDRHDAGMGLWNPADTRDKEGVALVKDAACVAGVGMREVLEKDVKPTRRTNTSALPIREPRLFRIRA